MIEDTKPRNRWRELIWHIRNDDENMNLYDSSPLLFVHIAALLGIFLVGFSGIALAVCAAAYFIRVFALTGGYHRYFSHNSYKTSRAFQFILAFVGASAAQLGPLWWASHHRHHHQHSDTEEDIHSPRQRGIWWSHIGWLLCRKYAKAELDRVRDFAKYPEIRFIDRFHVIAPITLAVGLFYFGQWLGTAAPGLGTSGWQMLVWGFFVSTVLVYHATFCINSLTHVFGRQRYRTDDDSRNNLLLALITMGEGWHNNHHRYPVSTRQGFYWWEIDATYYILKLFSKVGLVWDLRAPPPKVYEEAETVNAQQNASAT